MANRNSTGNNLVFFLCLVAVSVSFLVLLRRVETENILIFSFGISCFLLGYLIKGKHEKVKPTQNGLEEIKLPVQEHKKIPEEFLNEQERFSKLPPHLKEMKQSWKK